MGKKTLSKFHLDIQNFIRKENLLLPGESVICGVSGGVDSMTMVRVLKDLGFEIVMAHVNFGLRGLESEEDERWITNWAAKEKIDLHIKRIPKSHWEKGQNIQLEARKLRYEWFESLRKKLRIEKLAIAHHANDQVETILFQLFRGTGLAGLRGFLPNQANIIRPLAEKTKQEITFFAREFVKEWRNDSSNESDDYLRNQMRHQLMPILQSLFPGFEKVVLRNASRFRLLEAELDLNFRELQTNFGLPNEEGMKSWNWNLIKKNPSGQFFIAELLRQLGFSYSLLDEIWTSSHHQEVKKWELEGMRLEIQNDTLNYYAPSHFEAVYFEIKEKTAGEKMIPTLGKISWSQKSWDKNNLEDKYQCWVNPDKIVLPIIVRTWKEGDKIKPFGFQGRTKKVSDLLSEAKLKQSEREKTLVLENGNGELIWILGIRTSETFKLRKEGEPALQFEWQKKNRLKPVDMIF